MKELQDQLEAETYFSVKIYLIINASILIAQFYKDFAEVKTTDSVLEKKITFPQKEQEINNKLFWFLIKITRHRRIKL